MENLEMVGIRIYFNENIALSDLSALSSLTASNKISVINSEALQSLSGLENIGNLEHLTIIDNNSLSDCAVQSICEFLLDPNASAVIGNNLLGCNSPEEVEEACLTSTNEIATFENNIRIFPNPAKKTISFICSAQTKIQQIKIFNQTGILSIEENNPESTIDITSLLSGLYFVEIKTENRIFRKKLIIE